MINWFDMPEEGLSNGGQFEIKELTATENKVYQKDGEVYNKVTVNVEGGGGSSDFTTAEVTITNTASHPFMFLLPVIFHYEDDEEVMVPFLDSEDIDGGSVTVVLYKGECQTFFTSEYPMRNFEITASGNVEMGEDLPIIKGNGTITITDAA